MLNALPRVYAPSTARPQCRLTRVTFDLHRYAPHGVASMPLPIAGLVENGFYALVKSVFPLFFILAFLYSQYKVISELVHEKEARTRESLKIMGISQVTMLLVLVLVMLLLVLTILPLCLQGTIIMTWFITYGCIFGALSVRNDPC